MGARKTRKTAEHIEKRNQSQTLGVDLPEGYKEKMRRLRELSKEEQYKLLTSRRLQVPNDEEGDSPADSE